jgi:hypothetical protein
MILLAISQSQSGIDSALGDVTPRLPNESDEDYVARAVASLKVRYIENWSSVLLHENECSYVVFVLPCRTS